MEKLLILGASGLIGRALVKECMDRFDVYGTYATTSLHLPKNHQYQLKINEIDRMKDIIRSIKPDAIVSCLRGDFHEQLVFHKELAMEIKHTKSRLYYFSTANVFDGDFTKHHTELDSPNAESSYGRFKIDCEKVVQEGLNERAVIIRIPQIWGKESPRLESIKTGIEKNQLDLYSNLECNNLSDVSLARQLSYIMVNKLGGVFHLGSLDMMTHQRFAEEVASSHTNHRIQFVSGLFQQTNQMCYFGLKSIRTDIPESLLVTNQEVIKEITKER